MSFCLGMFCLVVKSVLGFLILCNWMLEGALWILCFGWMFRLVIGSGFPPVTCGMMPLFCFLEKIIRLVYFFGCCSVVVEPIFTILASLKEYRFFLFTVLPPEKNGVVKLSFYSCFGNFNFHLFLDLNDLIPASLVFEFQKFYLYSEVLQNHFLFEFPLFSWFVVFICISVFLCGWEGNRRG